MKEVETLSRRYDRLGRPQGLAEGLTFLLTRFLKRPATDPAAGSTSEASGQSAEVVKPGLPVPLPTNTDGQTRISPMAFVDPKAIIGEGCDIGPFCTVGPNVILGTGCKLISHVVLDGHTTIGRDNVFFPNSVIGSIPQDKKYRGEETRVEIGERNIFRESVTIHLGTVLGGAITRVGDDNLLMVNVHLGHDCQMGSRNIFANNVMLAGHVVVGNNVIMSGGAAAHHYVTIGDYAFIAGMARIHHDVPPFVKLSDNDKIRALNAEGLRRAGFTADDVEHIEEAAKRLFFMREKPFAAVLAEFDNESTTHPQVKQLVDFLRRRNNGKHGRFLESLRPRKNEPTKPTENGQPPADG